MYYWHLLQRDPSELTVKVLNAQKLDTEKNDWYELIQNDKKELDINLSDDQIRQFLKTKFKQFTKQKLDLKLRFELEQKRKSHSKAKFLDLFRPCPQKYILSTNMTVREIQLLVNLRTHMLSEAKINYKQKFGENIWCESCKLFPSSQEHLFNCYYSEMHSKRM